MQAMAYSLDFTLSKLLPQCAFKQLQQIHALIVTTPLPKHPNFLKISPAEHRVRIHGVSQSHIFPTGSSTQYRYCDSERHDQRVRYQWALRAMRLSV
ncbi:hypothetical protein FF1_041899 [Malus domestica]